MFGRLSLLYIGVIIIINPLNSLARAFKSQRGLKDSDDGGGGRMVSKWLYHPYDMQPSKFVTGSMGTQQWPLEFRSPAPVPRLLQAPRGGAFGGPSVPFPLKGTQGNGSVDMSVVPNKETDQNRINDALEPWNLAPALSAAPLYPKQNRHGHSTVFRRLYTNPGPNQLKNPCCVTFFSPTYVQAC